MKIEQIFWAAGFIDGEGCFGRCGGTIGVTVVSAVEQQRIDTREELEL